MDLRQYFKKLREVESSIEDEYPLVVSFETEDGGKAGRFTEVHRPLAAKLIAEGRCSLANEDQKKAHWEHEAEKKQNAERTEMAKRVQIAIVSDADLSPSIRPSKTEEKK